MRIMQKLDEKKMKIKQICRINQLEKEKEWTETVT